MSETQVAVITGGSRGIGRAICLELAARGTDIAFLDMGDPAVTEECLTLLRAIGVRAKAYRCDVSQPEDVKQTFSQVLTDFGTVDILVNNAGITRDKLAMTMSPEDFETVLRVNLFGAFYCAKQVIPPMIKQRRGKIINIASISGLMGNAGQSNYAASKAGIVGLTKSLARELASRNVTCNAVAPGFVDTNMTAALSSQRDTLISGIPLRRFAKPEEIAKVVAFLASSDADYITGEVIRVDGGMAM